MEMKSKSRKKADMFFFPYMGGGHQLPMIDIARLFAAHGAKSTIITTLNAAISFQNSIQRDRQSAGRDITIHSLDSPDDPAAAKLLLNTDMSAMPFLDTSMLREPLQRLLQERQPDCVVSDRFHTWAPEVIDGIGIPRITFNGNGCFARCAEEIVRLHKPYEMVSSDSEPFLLPGLPDKIEFTRSQIPTFMKSSESGLFFSEEMVRAMKTKQQVGFGVVVNSFYELEPAYVEYLKKEMGQKAWLVGPVSLCNRNAEDKAERGKKSAIDEQSCLNWLDSKTPNSVLYVSFGSLVRLAPKQLVEMAHGLEASKHPFVWAVGKTLKPSNSSDKDGEEENWVLEEFKERVEKSNQGLIIRGWAPQLLILQHAAIGGFMTHCGWNSTTEGVSAGVPMITWPLSAEQFYNEKLITDVLRIGVRSGNVDWAPLNDEPKVLIGREKVAEVVEKLMGDGGEAAEMRRRAEEIGKKARRAVEEGGSSYLDAEVLIEELISRRDNKFKLAWTSPEMEVSMEKTGEVF